MCRSCASSGTSWPGVCCGPQSWVSAILTDSVQNGKTNACLFSPTRLLYLFNEPKPGSITTMDMATSKMTLMVDFTTGPLKYIGLHDSTSSLFFADSSGNNIYSAHPESNPNNTDIVLQLDEKSRADITTGDIWYTLFCWSRSSSPFEIECKSRGDKTDKRDVYNNTARVTSLKIARPSGKQQLVTNHCQEKPCSHVCVLSSFSYRCLCPTGLVLQADQKTCK